MDSSTSGADALPDRDRILSMSGLEYLQEMLAGRLPGPPMARTMGFALASAEPGRVVFRGAPGAAHLNPFGGLHGGWYGALLDSALSCAVWTRVPRGSVYTTLEYKVNLVRALSPGVEVACEGTVAHAGRSTGVASGEIRGVADGKLYASGSATCLIMKMD